MGRGARSQVETVIDKKSKNEYAVKVDDDLVFLFVFCPLFKYSYFLPETNKDQLLKPMFSLNLPRMLIKFAMEIHIFSQNIAAVHFVSVLPISS